MSKQQNNGTKPQRVAVEIHYDTSGQYLPNVYLHGKTVNEAVETLRATVKDRLLFLAMGLAVVARDPSSPEWEKRRWSEALLEHVTRQGQGEAQQRTGLYFVGFEGIKYGKAPEAKTPKHRRLPKPQKGRRRKWHPDYVDAVPTIIKAARSENWAGLTTN